MDFGTAWSRRMDRVQLLRQGEARVWTRLTSQSGFCDSTSASKERAQRQPEGEQMVSETFTLLGSSPQVRPAQIQCPCVFGGGSFLHTRPLRSWYHGPYYAFGGFTLCDWRVTS